MRRFDHPNIAKLYETWSSNDFDTIYMSMEFVPGSLRSIISKMPGEKMKREYAVLYMY